MFGFGIRDDDELDLVHTTPEQSPSTNPWNWRNYFLNMVGYNRATPQKAENKKSAEKKADQFVVSPQFEYGPDNIYSRDSHVIINQDGAILKYSDVPRFAENEANVLQDLNKQDEKQKCIEQISCFKGFATYKKHKYMVNENLLGYIPLRDLPTTPLSDRQRIHLALELVSILDYIHSKHVAHNHIHLDTIFFRQDTDLWYMKNVVKFTNFERACKHSENQCPQHPFPDAYFNINYMNNVKDYESFENLIISDWYALFACIFYIWFETLPNVYYIDFRKLPESILRRVNPIVEKFKLHDHVIFTNVEYVRLEWKLLKFN